MVQAVPIGKLGSNLSGFSKTRRRILYEKKNSDLPFFSLVLWISH